MRLRADRELSEFGGYGVNRQLRAMTNSPWVVWVNSNSYVCCKRSDGTFQIISINGIGEIRWVVPDHVSWDKEAVEARAYFLEEVDDPRTVEDRKQVLNG